MKFISKNHDKLLLPLRKIVLVMMLLFVLLIVIIPSLKLNDFGAKSHVRAYAQSSKTTTSNLQKFSVLGEQKLQELLTSSIIPSKKTNIALIVPIFTDAAYNNAFYLFYSIYANLKPAVNVTHNLDLLSSRLTALKPTNYSSSPGKTLYILAKHLTLLSPLYHVNILTDADVDAGSIFFSNATNKYDILVLDHQEYVTQNEYDNLKQFVTNGGTMILLDANALYAQVGYDRTSQTVTLIKGHSWEFNGKSAWKSVNETWANQNSQWIGSNFLCFHVRCSMTFVNNPFGYKPPHEEQYLTNPNDTILLNYNASVLSPNPNLAKNATMDHDRTIAAYELSYKKGKIIALGILSDDIITDRPLMVFLDHLIATKIQ